MQPAVWDRVIDEYAQAEDELSNVATVAYLSEEKARAESAAKRADAAGNGVCALNLGMLRERDDLEGAEPGLPARR